ncbi:hypothetical protein ABT234_09985 [Streptomyces sp. NPDC001586]|uniref:hypothetical protein n=1 Tax=unclassified Streptomyces TaxID=2593676 RepID=UPI003327229E
MPGFLAHQGATTLCIHLGQAQPVAPNPRVTVSGQATVVLGVSWLIAGCLPQPPGNPPCATAQWTTGTTRVRSVGMPLVLQGGTAVCVPTGGPLTVAVVQVRVRGI